MGSTTNPTCGRCPTPKGKPFWLQVIEEDFGERSGISATSQLDVQCIISERSIRGSLSHHIMVATAWVAIMHFVRSVTPPQDEKNNRVSPPPTKRCRKMKVPCFGDAHGPPSQDSAWYDVCEAKWHERSRSVTGSERPRRYGRRDLAGSYVALPGSTPASETPRAR